jgi:hypothetical protein
MYLLPPPSTLLPNQTRMINASEGFRLEVLEGCLWLTRPGDESDRFLHSGSHIVLTQNSVLIQSDWNPACAPPVAACYRLVPLTGRAPSGATPRSRAFQWALSRRWWHPLQA